MATPKKKTSKSARDMRRSHLALSETMVNECPNCGEYYIYHTVCPACGYYRGKVAIEKEA